MVRIVFVCHGNICRSPMAEFVMKDIVRRAGRAGDFAISSRACRRDDLGADMHRGSREMLEKHGIPFEPRRATLFTLADYEAADVVVGMDGENADDLAQMTGGDPAGKYRLLMTYAGEDRDVADPWYTGDFEAAYRDVAKGCQALFAALSAPEGGACHG